ncbi:acyl-phosphate glycerol 3-phosphate acyltransferase [Secundilactobacillus paracollinoides]|uniref:Acyl-phosphate glycerol 3-phosphate acyltransferase n=1 Tax=Secundilactobacillus paracollinoides TaxID=240427 RepID=A0A1B2J0E5_9LACO|nr:1-acyl-sn-glycerol-3-phosphate acyltransferase [Secundilactobacillus paracollinoides]ANZ61852.1 acyl-phosphate glycerol 3-phosphate acyltransferase [Secundilactobacillus paracollinoides]ANZ63491.1 acyl-phosphate glycerol 3-phosphate acyltransferase [Secundilactobacillus paracollinoides]ANZ67772.1 acyl-phosphate glycerol 3-phosphate acyltransferase [Secundilactobacillus paracollinoides]KRL75749.1 1-acyl-sn-glycerol-3-phosphate acyltransferase [Secundilactobacillus paracollinoides DSM 15502 = 
MFYSFLRVLVRIILFVVNGHNRFINKDRLPEGNYILVGPHRTWFDPIYYALAASPKKFSFMAKIELFKNPILSFILRHANAFPVDRNHPGPSAIKTPVKTLRDKDLSLVMFPSGTRHSQELKGGVAVIAKMAKVPIVPTVYQGPLTFKELFSRHPVTVSFGDPFYVDPKLKLNEEGLAKVEHQMQSAFDALDKEIDPNFRYVDVTK